MCFYQNTYDLFLKNKEDKCKYNINKNLTCNLDDNNSLYLYKSICFKIFDFFLKDIYINQYLVINILIEDID